MSDILGWPLDEALAELRTRGVGPVTVIESRAPRRTPGLGAPRVVRVRDNGRVLVVCSFLDCLQEKGEGHVQE